MALWGAAQGEVGVPVAFVTGAQRGIGKETARQLLERGHSVVIGSFDPVEARATVEELSGLGDVRSVDLDVTDDDSIAAAFAEITAAFPSLDVLVNNAGIVALGSALDVTREQLRDIFEVNVFGAVLVTRAALPLLRKSDHPRIVNMSSGGGSLTQASALAGPDFHGAPIIAYAASKTALNMVTVQTNLLLQGTPELRHIKINSVTPGTTATHVSGFQGQTVAEGARVVVRLATIDDDGPSGGFFDFTGPVPW